MYYLSERNFKKEIMQYIVFNVEACRQLTTMTNEQIGESTTHKGGKRFMHFTQQICLYLKNVTLEYIDRNNIH